MLFFCNSFQFFLKILLKCRYCAGYGWKLIYVPIFLTISISSAGSRIKVVSLWVFYFSRLFKYDKNIKSNFLHGFPQEAWLEGTWTGNVTLNKVRFLIVLLPLLSGLDFFKCLSLIHYWTVGKTWSGLYFYDGTKPSYAWSVASDTLTHKNYRATQSSTS